MRGQYRGYTDIDGVAKHSQTETFVALRVEIDNWRWAGVPIFLRAGKALTERVTEVRLFTHRVPALAFLPDRRRAEPNQIVLRIDPDPGLRLQLTAIDGDRWRDLHLDSSFMQDLGEPITPYERLLHAGLTGDHQLFAREDGIEETWRIVQPLLDKPAKLHPYEPGSWGPDAARGIVTRSSRLATAVASRQPPLRRTGQHAARHDRPGPDGRQHRPPADARRPRMRGVRPQPRRGQGDWHGEGDRRGAVAGGLGGEARQAAGGLGDGAGRRHHQPTVIDELAPPLEPGDIVIDGGNSYYRDDIAGPKPLSARRASTTSTWAPAAASGASSAATA